MKKVDSIVNFTQPNAIGHHRFLNMLTLNDVNVTLLFESALVITRPILCQNFFYACEIITFYTENNCAEIAQENLVVQKC